MQNLLESGQLSSEQAAVLQTLGNGESDGDIYDNALAVNQALREIEERLTGAAAGRPPLPPRGAIKEKDSHQPDGKRKAVGAQPSTDALRTLNTEAPKREVRRPSGGTKAAARGPGEAAAGMAVMKGPGEPAVMKGATWMDWEPRRDVAREDASFTNDELYRIR